MSIFVTIVLWVQAVFLIASIILSANDIGKPRKPLTATTFSIVLIFNLLFATCLILRILGVA